MGFPVVYRKNSSRNLTSYNYVDIADGTGIVEFYGAKKGTSTSSTYVLTTNQVYSDEVYTRGGATMNFDTNSFNSPRVIKGTAFLNAGVYMSVSGGLTSITVKIQKCSGGVYTDCSSEISARIPGGNGGHKMMLVPIPLTQTNFKIGDSIRCVVVQTVTNGDVDFGHDPMGRNGGQITSSVTDPTITSKMSVLIPFRIDL